MRTLVLGGKYIIRDKISNKNISIQISQLNDVELSFIDLDCNDFDNNEFYRELNDIDIIDTINENEAKQLNEQEVFSVHNDLIKAIVGREEIIDLSKSDFTKINKDNNTVIISITDPDRAALSSEILNKFKDYLSISFWDVEEEIGRIKPINKLQAKEIKEFIIKNKNNNFVIHCEAGMSRSSGVGLAVELYCKFDGDRYLFSTSKSDIKKHHRYHPNYTVFDMIVEE